MSACKVSYVLPVFNGQNTVARCIDSLLAQTVKPHEIIVLNDGSTDHSKRIIESYGAKISVLNYCYRHGAAHARNAGNDIASGDVIAVCDCDIYYKDRGKAIVEFFEEFPDKDVFYSALHLRTADDLLGRGLMEAYEWDGQSKCPISHPTVAHRKLVSDQIRYHEESIETDLYEFFLLDAMRAGFKFGGCQNPLMLKIEGDSNRKTLEAKQLKVEKYKSYGIEVQM